MSTSPESVTQDNEDFTSAFAADAPAKPEVSEEAAFGLDGAAEAGAEADAPESPEGYEMPDEAASEAQSGGEGGDPAGSEAPSVAIVLDEPAADADSSVPSDEPMSEEDTQRAKSWEGRLRAREAELRAREDALNGKINATTNTSVQSGSDPAHSEQADAGEPTEPGESMAQEVAEPAATEAVENAVEAVQSGEMTADEAMKTLSQDFGEDFTKMLGVLIAHKASEIAGKTADERVGPLGQKMDGIVSEIKNRDQAAHFEKISGAHPDYAEVAGSPEFKAFVDNMNETDKAAAMQTIETGTAKEIIALLASYKAGVKGEPDAGSMEDAAPAQDAVDDSSLDAAEGVRSSGLKIPDRPPESQDYEEAWSKF